MALVTPSAHASDVEEQEALHLHSFIGCIDWPASALALPASAIVVGNTGAQQTLPFLSQVVAGKVVQGRPVQVRRMQQPEYLPGSHLACIGREAWEQFADWLAASKKHDVVRATNAPVADRVVGVQP